MSDNLQDRGQQDRKRVERIPQHMEKSAPNIHVLLGMPVKKSRDRKIQDQREQFIKGTVASQFTAGAHKRSQLHACLHGGVEICGNRWRVLTRGFVNKLHIVALGMVKFALALITDRQVAGNNSIAVR